MSLRVHKTVKLKQAKEREKKKRLRSLYMDLILDTYCLCCPVWANKCCTAAYGCAARSAEVCEGEKTEQKTPNNAT